MEFFEGTLRLVQTLGTLNKSLNMVINSHVHLETFLSLEKIKLRLMKIIIKLIKKQNMQLALKNFRLSTSSADLNIFKFKLKIEKTNTL